MSPKGTAELELRVPRRFKTAFIFFSSQRHKEIKEELAKEGKSEKTTNIAKMVSKEWREMTDESRNVWNEKSRIDKERYDDEMQNYNQARKLSKTDIKDPNAPRRPMSAFLAFSNKRRASLKREHPTATNADLSKMLSKSWKELSPALKQEYIEEEAKLRADYKTSAVLWRKKKAEEAKASAAKKAAEEQLESARALGLASTSGLELNQQSILNSNKQDQSALLSSLASLQSHGGIGFYPTTANPFTSNNLLGVFQNRAYCGAPSSIDAALLENLSDQLRYQQQVEQTLQQQLVSSMAGTGYIGQQIQQQPSLAIHSLRPGFLANGQNFLQQPQVLERNLANGGIVDGTWPNQQSGNIFLLPPGFPNNSWFR